MNARFLMAAALLAAAVTAQAADMTIYEDANFGGRSATLRGPMPDVRSLGFNDRTSSLVVRSGTWEVCTDVAFRGYCATLAPGQYPALDPRLNDRISSAREVTLAATEPVPVRPRPEFSASIEMFGQPGFRGRAMELNGDAPDLVGSNFNDRASSVVVREGTWELCSDRGYRGTCRVYPPGRYADLGPGMAREISSARVVRAPEQPPLVQVAPPAPVQVTPPVVNAPPARIILYDGDNFGGRSLTVVDDVIDLRRSDFNDDTRSVLVESGMWELCTDPYFRGQCRIIGPGQYRRLEGPLDRSVSSIRLATAPVIEPRPQPLPQAAVELFDDVDFRGRRFSALRDIPNLDPTGFNDRASSMIINEGRWEVCVDGGYRGRCAIFGPGRYADLGGFRNEISSLRRVN